MSTANSWVSYILKVCKIFEFKFSILIVLLMADGLRGEDGTNVRKHLVNRVMICLRQIRVFVEHDLVIIRVRRMEVHHVRV